MIVKLSIFILQLVTQFITQTLNLSQEYQKEILMLDCKEKYWNFLDFVTSPLQCIITENRRVLPMCSICCTQDNKLCCGGVVAYLTVIATLRSVCGLTRHAQHLKPSRLLASAWKAGMTNFRHRMAGMGSSSQSIFESWAKSPPCVSCIWRLVASGQS